MEDAEMERLKFPVGRQPRAVEFVRTEIDGGIGEIAAFPALLRKRAEGLSDAQLERRYRPGGWTARQVIHHVADSHINSYTRFKLALTEDRPTIKPYFEDRWAELPDGKSGNIGVSLAILEGIHARWTSLLRSLDEAAFRRRFFHPESQREIPLFESVGVYAWHGRHHLAHVELALGG